MKKIFIIAITLLCVACQQTEDSQQRNNGSRGIEIAQDDRFIVSRVQVVNDDLAYDGQRGVYVIIDKHTGAEYLGVSGVGISELGSHHSGKVNKRDER